MKNNRWNLSSTSRFGSCADIPCVSYSFRWEYVQGHSVIREASVIPAVTVVWKVKRVALQYRCRYIVGVGLLRSMPDGTEVQNPACWFWVLIVHRLRSPKRRGLRFPLRIAGLRRLEQRAAQDKDMWRRSDLGDCGNFSEVGGRATRKAHWQTCGWSLGLDSSCAVLCNAVLKWRKVFSRGQYGKDWQTAKTKAKQTQVPTEKISFDANKIQYFSNS